jgi:hypothetical protein
VLGQARPPVAALLINGHETSIGHLYDLATGTVISLLPVRFAVVAVVVVLVLTRGHHRENRAEYSCSDIFEIPDSVCELIAFGFAESSDHKHAVGFGGQNRGVGGRQQRGRIDDHIVEGPTQFAQDFLGCQRPK